MTISRYSHSVLDVAASAIEAQFRRNEMAPRHIYGWAQSINRIEGWRGHHLTDGELELAFEMGRRAAGAS